MLPGPRHRELTSMRTLFTCSLNWEYEVAVHQVRATEDSLPYRAVVFFGVNLNPFPKMQEFGIL